MITIPIWLLVGLVCLSLNEIIALIYRIIRKAIVIRKLKRHNVLSEGVDFKRKR